MTYHRIVPRDLFHESKLLKCLGHLILRQDDPKQSMGITTDLEEPETGFQIRQDPSTGYFYCQNLKFFLNGNLLDLYIPAQSGAKAPYPLWCETGVDSLEVLDDDGNITDEFRHHFT